MAATPEATWRGSARARTPAASRASAPHAPPLPARFGEDSVSLCDISETGARLRHSGRFEMGAKSTLRVALDGRPVNVEAMVVWTQRDSGGMGGFVSGVRAYAAPEAMKSIVRQLAQARRTTQMEELRRTDRYDIRPAMTGAWNGEDVRIEDISTRGARVATAPRQRLRTPGPPRFAVPEPAVRLALAGTMALCAL